jgi:hypothetical protein
MKFFSVLIFLAVSFCSFATDITLKANGELTFFGHSSIHDFKGQVSTQPFKIFLMKSKNGHTTVNTEIKINVKNMTTGNGNRDRKMYNMFNAKSFPVIQGVIKNMNSSLLKRSNPATDALSGVVPMELTISDITNKVPVTITDCIPHAEGEYQFKISFSLSLKDFNLHPKRGFFGLIRVYDNVEVEGKVTAILDGPSKIKLLKEKIKEQLEY